MSQTAVEIRQEHSARSQMHAMIKRFSVSAEELCRERTDNTQSPPLRLRRMLNEIDETVLPRAIEIIVSGDVVASLSVDERRLRGVSAARCGGSNEQPSLKEAAQILTELSQLPGQFELNATRRSLHEKSQGLNYSALSLMSVLGLNDTPDPLANLQELASKSAHAIFTWRAALEDVQFSGDAAHKELLSVCASSVIAERSRVPNAVFASNEMSGYALGFGQNEIVLIAANGLGGFAAILSRDTGLQAVETMQLLSA